MQAVEGTHEVDKRAAEAAKQLQAVRGNKWWVRLPGAEQPLLPRKRMCRQAKRDAVAEGVTLNMAAMHAGLLQGLAPSDRRWSDVT